MPPTMNSSNFHAEKMYLHQGDSFSFILHFNGVPWPNITLFFNDEILISYSDPDLSPISLSINNFTIKNEGIYYARVMNSMGFVETNRTELCLLQGPSFMSINQQFNSVISIKPNQTINLIIPTIKTNSPDPVTVIWFLENKILKQSFDTNILNSNLTIHSSLQKEHITCLIENKYGEIGYYFKLEFLQAPYFLLTLPKQLYVELGENIILLINVTGNPIPNVQWLYNNHILDNRQYEYHISHNYILHSLIITNFTLTDIGNYSVLVSNSENTIASETQILLKSSQIQKKIGFS
ncbi:hypothetical protein I4U23_030707 [Adineta vaga]|nr:hypothetical protein I4U23_030707 [Adineta vaga]